MELDAVGRRVFLGIARSFPTRIRRFVISGLASPTYTLTPTRSSGWVCFVKTGFVSASRPSLSRCLSARVLLSFGRTLALRCSLSARSWEDGRRRRQVHGTFCGRQPPRPPPRMLSAKRGLPRACPRTLSRQLCLCSGSFCSRGPGTSASSSSPSRSFRMASPWGVRSTRVRGGGWTGVGLSVVSRSELGGRRERWELIASLRLEPCSWRDPGQTSHPSGWFSARVTASRGPQPCLEC